MTTHPQQYVIGVDTGGTFTDAVLVDAATREVLASAKRPTTHYDLSVGMEASMSAVLAMCAERSPSAGIPPVSPSAVTLVAVSTTLATNAVVEDSHRTAVGLIIVGWGNRIDVPGAVAVRHIPGGHRMDGSEQEAFSLEALVDAVSGFKGRVDAYAVCSLMSFVNPAHELLVARAIGMIDPKPVFCSHAVSSRAGMQERAATAVLNARLLPVMENFLAGMRAALTRLGITAEVVVVRGDATVMPLDMALHAAASTVASGPAATAAFGSTVASGDALVVDVGGTTTDVTLLRNGRPVLAADGLCVGDWVTHVEAVEMFTVGVGGDSYVQLHGDDILVGPQRVTPLCMAGALPDVASWIGLPDGGRCLVPIFVPGVDVPSGSDEGRILALLREHGPLPHRVVGEALSLPGIMLDQAVLRLTRSQLAFDAGFTPTDALHVLGLLELGDAMASNAGAAALGRERGMDGRKFARHVVESTRRLIEDAVIEHVARREVGGNLAAYLRHRREHALLCINVSLGVPMVGIGAAARYLLPDVSETLQTTVAFPEWYAVGNALGAALLGLDNKFSPAREGDTP